MLAILKREIVSYFTSAIGYVVLSIFLAFSGFYFYATCLMSNSADISYTFSNLFTVLIFLVPIITMRLMSEERKQKTDQLLFTSPVSIIKIVLAKFFSALVMVLICESITLFYTLIISFFTLPNFGILFGNFFGMLLMAGALLSIGLFLSSTTENQIVAAVSTFAVGVFILLLDTIAKSIPVEFITNFLLNLSFMKRYNNFTSGIFSLPDVTFFISVIFVFIFLTVRLFQKKK